MDVISHACALYKCLGGGALTCCVVCVTHSKNVHACCILWQWMKLLAEPEPGILHITSESAHDLLSGTTLQPHADSLPDDRTHLKAPVRMCGIIGLFRTEVGPSVHLHATRGRWLVTGSSGDAPASGPIGLLSPEPPD